MKIGIVGGSIIGLTSGYFLSRQGHEVTVFEAEKVTGGLSSSFQLGDGSFLERYYHYYSPCDTKLIDLAEELGISAELLWGSTKEGAFIDGELFPSSGIFDMMKLPGMGVLEKLKFFGSMFFLLKTNDWRPLDRISCKDWITTNAGKNVYEVLWKHLFEAKFGLHADEVPASWLWSRARRVAGSRKNLFSHERFGYFRNSSKSLLDSLEKYIISKNGRVLLQTRVDSVAAQEKGTVIITENGSKTEFDRVLLTVPIPEVKRISSQALGNYSKEFLNIEYCAITTLVLELKESFSEYFIINVCDSAVPFPAIIEFSNLRPKDETNGSNLIYIPNYVSCSSREYALNKDELLAHYMPYLKKINSKFDASKVLKSHVFKDDYAEAYMFRGYAEHVPGFSTPLKGVYIANSAQIYPWSKLVESSIGHAEKVSKEIIG